MDHCRCYTLYATQIWAVCNSDTIELFPQKTTISLCMPTNVVIQATHGILKVFITPMPIHPVTTVGHTQLEAIEQLAKMFSSNHTKKQQPTKNPTNILKPPTESLRVQPTVSLSPRVLMHTHFTGQNKTHHANCAQQRTIHHTNAVIDPITNDSIEYWQLFVWPKHCNIWLHSFANELGRPAQGIGNQEKGTNTI